MRTKFGSDASPVGLPLLQDLVLKLLGPIFVSFSFLEISPHGVSFGLGEPFQLGRGNPQRNVNWDINPSETSEGPFRKARITHALVTGNGSGESYLSAGCLPRPNGFR